MQKIIVKNFRQITSAEIEIKAFLVLIGEQASGKSTLAKLIYFFKSLKEDYFNLIYENANKNESNLERIFIKRIQDKFNIYFGYTTDLPEDFEITFYYRFINEKNQANRYLKLSKNRVLNVQFDYDYFGEILNNTRDLAKAINSFTRRQTKGDVNNYIVLERTKIRFISELSEKINTLFHDNYTPMFFPAGRSITVSYPEQFQTLFFGNLNSHTTPENTSRSVDQLQMKSFILHSKFLHDYFNGSNLELKIENYTQNNLSIHSLEFFKIHSEYILQGKYENSDGVERIIYDTENNKSIPFNLASSGSTRGNKNHSRFVLHTL
jgi:energy-coupling factor transporter ATP-binding protein EcfA2